MTDLAPCPHCGTPSIPNPDAPGCSNVDCLYAGIVFPSAESWNTRPCEQAAFTAGYQTGFRDGYFRKQHGLPYVDPAKEQP